MARSLTPKRKLSLKRAPDLLKEYQSCGINSILTILHNLGHPSIITIEDLKKIFDYTEEGIALEQYRFRKLNALLDAKKIPYKFRISKYRSLQELFKQLDISPIPVFFWMKVLEFTPKTYKDVEFQFQFGDVHQDKNQHILLMIGYDQEKEEVYFLDPSYQLPWLKSSVSSLQGHEFALKKKAFYECVSQLKTYMEVVYSPAVAKSYKKEAIKKSKEKERQKVLFE